MFSRWGFIFAILCIFLGITLNLEIPKKFHVNDNLSYVQSAISDKKELANKVSQFANKDEFYRRAFSVFKNEEIQTLSVDSVNEVTTIFGYILNQREFEIVINETKDASYLLTLVINENLTYKIAQFYLRIA